MLIYNAISSPLKGAIVLESQNPDSLGCSRAVNTFFFDGLSLSYTDPEIEMFLQYVVACYETSAAWTAFVKDTCYSPIINSGLENAMKNCFTAKQISMEYYVSGLLVALSAQGPLVNGSLPDFSNVTEAFYALAPRAADLWEELRSNSSLQLYYNTTSASTGLKVFQDDCDLGKVCITFAPESDLEKLLRFFQEFQPLVFTSIAILSFVLHKLNWLLGKWLVKKD